MLPAPMKDGYPRRDAPMDRTRLAALTNELNNLLTVIEGYARLSASQLPDGNPVHAHLDEILRAADAAAKVARELGHREPTPRAEPAPTPAVAPLPAFARVLLVEDDRAVRLFTQAILKLNGFEVLTAASGAEA